MSSAVQYTASTYQRLLRELRDAALCEEELDCNKLLDKQRLQELQAAWSCGLLGHEGVTAHHGAVRIIDFGQWSRDGVYDIVRAQIEIEGRWCSGPIIFTTEAQDWERLGYGEDTRYDDVILHVSPQPAPPHWYTRTSKQRHVPYLGLDETRWRDILQIPPLLHREQLQLCQAPLSHLDTTQLRSVLLSAAAHRVLQKRTRFQQRASVLGLSQCWYEAWAEALGYYQNRFAMRVLAQRAPLALLRSEPTEALLFGIAGLLTPILPESCDEEVRFYHRQIWDAWWALRDEHELQGRHAISWHLGHTRPANHPHRRLAALAATVARWDEWESLLRADRLKELFAFAASLEHSYWKHHTSLPSSRLSRAISLIGKQRMNAFLVNSILVFDESDLAWQLYQQQRESALPSKVLKIAHALAGEREDWDSLLRSCAIQQGILQIASDFASEQKGAAQLFPESLGQMNRP